MPPGLPQGEGAFLSSELDVSMACHARLLLGFWVALIAEKALTRATQPKNVFAHFLLIPFFQGSIYSSLAGVYFEFSLIKG